MSEFIAAMIIGIVILAIEVFFDGEVNEALRSAIYLALGSFMFLVSAIYLIFGVN